ncbi:MAG TPA: TonB-dependent receptor [Opitutaceae bacterium]|nr:TonB-dependent receptor [Opitutaceae bacterium]
MRVARLRRFVGFLFAWSALVSVALAQATGSIRGRVMDAGRNAPLAGAEITVSETGLRAVAGRDGTYQINGLAAGTYTLAVSYLGYEGVSERIEVAADRVATAETRLGSEVVVLTEFKVEGAREGQARALNQQKAAGSVKNIIAADAMGNFPDKNVAESLQRVPGIHTEGQRGEARFITVRGAAPSLNSITMDGVSILGTEADFRTVSLDVFPSAQLSGIEVVKALTPDLDADSIGGAILLKGRSAFDAGRRVATANFSATYNDLSEKTGYRGAFTYGDLLGSDKDWGVQISYSKERVNGLEQNIETNDWTPITALVNGQTLTGFLPVTLLQTHVTVRKDRESLSGVLEKKFNSGLRLWVRGFSNQFEEFNLRHGLRYATGVTATGGNLDTTQPVVVNREGTFTNYTATRATARRQIQPRAIDDTSAAVSAGAALQKQDWSLEVTAAYSRADSELKTEQGQWVSKSNLNTSRIDQTDPDFWRLTQLTGTSLFDPSGLRFNQLLVRRDYLFNDETILKVDGTREFQLARQPLKVAAGTKFRWNTKSRNNDPIRYDSLVGGAALDFSDPRLGGNTIIDQSYLRGRYDFGPSVNAVSMRDFFIANDATWNTDIGNFADTNGLFVPNLGNTLNNALVNDYKIKEDITAGYLRADYTVGKWNLIAGARWEQTDLDFTVIRVNANLPNTNRARYVPLLRSSSYDDIMPSFHIKYDYSKNLVFRGAWSNTLARPIAGDMVPAFNVDSANAVITGGNPNLQAVTSGNIDLSAEYYLARVGIVSLGYFYKDLDGPIYTANSSIDFDDGTGSKRYTYVTKLNAGKARLSGVELSYQQQLRFLPSPFDGLGVYGNLTWVDSDVDVPQRPGESFTLFKQAKSVGNVALSYQKYGWSGRLSYSMRSQYLSELVAAGRDVFYDDDTRLDLQVGYRFREHWTVQFTANNLEDSPELQYHGVRSRQLFYGMTGRSYSLGLSWEL